MTTHWSIPLLESLAVLVLQAFYAPNVDAWVRFAIGALFGICIAHAIVLYHQR